MRPFHSDVLSKVILLSEYVNSGRIPLPSSLGLPLNFDKKIRFAIELHICVTNTRHGGGREGGGRLFLLRTTWVIAHSYRQARLTHSGSCLLQPKKGLIIQVIFL